MFYCISFVTHLRVRLWNLILVKWLHQTRSKGLTGYSDLSVLRPLRRDLGWNNSGGSATAGIRANSTTEKDNKP